MERRLVGHPIEAALTRAAPHQHRPAMPLPQSQPAEMLRLHDVTIAYDRHPVVHHIGGSFEGGSLTALVGPNGAGKSTLLKAIAGLLPVTAGEIRFGLDRRAVGYLPQVVDVDRSFPLRVIDVVDFGHWRKIGALRRLAGDDRAASIAAVASVGLRGLEYQPIGKLSVGQFQRVLFARLMLQDAPVLLLDEPFAGVDSRTVEDLLTILRRWNSEGRTIVTVLHDLDLAHDAFPRTLLLGPDPGCDEPDAWPVCDATSPNVVAWGPTAAALTEANRVRAGLLRQPSMPTRQPAF
jgi:zinc/manganese transport system ATP-binding protein